MALVFESAVCSRCGGTGHYSFNQKDGSVCFGCGGKCERLTKRGKAAQIHYSAKLKISVNDVVVGMRIRYDNDRFTVLEIKDNDSGKIFVASKCSYGFLPNSEVLRIPADEERVVLINESLAFQATLTKAGKVSKRKTTNPIGA